MPPPPGFPKPANSGLYKYPYSGFFYTMETLFRIFPHDGKKFSTLWKTSNTGSCLTRGESQDFPPLCPSMSAVVIYLSGKPIPSP